jgi:hypothetical protein
MSSDHSSDTLGLYRILGVSSRASAEEIKSAYRSRAMELHPDRNPDRDTTSEFQDLQAAYAILSNDYLREQYNADCSIPKNSDQDFEEAHTYNEPICCSKCHAVSAQPRYKVFYAVYGLIFRTSQIAYEGIFCAKCEIQEALKSSAITLVFGWWSIRGFLLSVQVLLKNLVGGKFYEQNARLQGYQAMYFAHLGRNVLAGAVALQAIELIRVARREQMNSLGNTIRSKLGYDTPDPLESVQENLNIFLDSLQDVQKIPTLKSRHDILNKRFTFQLVLLLIFTCIIFGLFFLT